MVGHHSRGLLQPVGNAARHVLVFSFFCSVEVWARVRVFGKESITATGKDMDRTRMGTAGVMEKYFFYPRIMQNVLFPCYQIDC